ncbi:hypothetical protein [Lysinibacillus xylanilyticus]
MSFTKDTVYFSGHAFYNVEKQNVQGNLCKCCGAFNEVISDKNH